MPLVQGGKSERLVELASGGQQHIQQSLHLGGGLRLAIGQRKAKAACDRGAHLARVELFAFDGGGAQAFAAQQGRHRFLGQGCFKGTNPLQQLLTGLVGLIEQGLQALRIPAEPGPVGLLPDPGRGHGFRLIAS